MRNFFKKRRAGAVAVDERAVTAGGRLGSRTDDRSLSDRPVLDRSPADRPPADRPMMDRAANSQPRLRPVGGMGPAMSPGGMAPVDHGRAPPSFARPSHAEAPPADMDLPRFSIPVAGGLRGPGGANAPAMLRGLTPEVNGILREAFTPTRPKQKLNSLFIGRTATLRRIISAIEEERAHVILFGDRGRGKTSVTNGIEQIAAQGGYLALKLTCSAELSFEDIFRHFLKKIPATYYRTASAHSPFSAGPNFTNLADLLPADGFSVTELNEVMAGIYGTHVLLMLDEYDRVTDEDFRNKLAELFKNLTDSSIPVTLFVVGVAENLDQLLGKHPSIQRSLVPVHLPLMTDREVERLLQAGAENAKLGFSSEAAKRICDFARGLPYYAQLLGLHAARSAVSRQSDTVEREDLSYAVSRCLQEAERGIVVSYAKALAPQHRDELEDVLLAAALCPADEYGIFDPADLAAPGETVSQSFREKLNRLVSDEHGAVLEPVLEPGRIRYRFQNQMMRQYVLMRQAQERGQI